MIGGPAVRSGSPATSQHTTTPISPRRNRERKQPVAQPVPAET
jgi:hypothetical protein